MATLKHAGIVRTTLGAHGGYAIAADPAAVSIGRVIRLLDGALAPLGCVSLRYYEPCSCVGRGDLRAARHDARRARRDARDPRQRDAGATSPRDRGAPRSIRAGSTPTRWPAGDPSPFSGRALHPDDLMLDFRRASGHPDSVCPWTAYPRADGGGLPDRPVCRPWYAVLASRKPMAPRTPEIKHQGEECASLRLSQDPIPGS